MSGCRSSARRRHARLISLCDAVRLTPKACDFAASPPRPPPRRIARNKSHGLALECARRKGAAARECRLGHCARLLGLTRYKSLPHASCAASSPRAASARSEAGRMSSARPPARGPGPARSPVPRVFLPESLAIVERARLCHWVGKCCFPEPAAHSSPGRHPAARAGGGSVASVTAVALGPCFRAPGVAASRSGDRPGAGPPARRAARASRPARLWPTEPLSWLCARAGAEGSVSRVWTSSDRRS